MLKIDGCSDTAHHGNDRQDDGHGAAQPGPGHERLLLPGHPERRQAQHDAQRPRHNGQHQPDDERRQAASSPSSSGVTSRPSSDEHADLGDPAERVGEAAGGGPVRQLAVAQHQRGEIDGEEAAARAARRAAYASDGDRHDRDRIEPGGGQGDVPEAPGAQPADRDADGRADGQLREPISPSSGTVLGRARLRRRPPG